MKTFLLFFILIILGELYLLIQFGGLIGAFPTILLIVLTAILGIGLMRSQGLMVIQKMQGSLLQGALPKLEMIEGVFIFIGGVFLLAPGLFLDFIGVLFLIPPARKFFANKFIEKKSNDLRYKHQENIYETEWQEKPEDQKVLEGEVLGSDKGAK